ncbi:MAG: MotA/TolQ/ExbB proton channel family protein [Treponema sp.]|nr:MotA/TolQ/ExbB proton channel family protein [Treponema sp.]
MEDNIGNFTLLELFHLGGPVMWPLAFFSVATFAIAIERAFVFFYSDLRVERERKEVSRLIARGDWDGAVGLLSPGAKRRAGAGALLAFVSRARAGAAGIEAAGKAAEAEAGRRANALENGLGLLTALGSMAPLTGFLGTVTGMIGAFGAIAEAADASAQTIAAGIYEALVTTVVGLAIAIIAMAAHALFSHAIERYAFDVESACARLAAQIEESA